MATGKIDISRKLLLRHYQFTYRSALAAGSVKRWLPGTAGYSIPEGFVPIGITRFSTGSQYAVLNYIQPTNNSGQTTNYLCAVRNVSSSSSVSASNSVIVDILFAPEEMVEIYTTTPSNKETVFKVKSFSGSYSSVASGSGDALSNTDCGFSIPDGYEIFCIRNISSGSMNVSISDCNPFAVSRFITIRNTHTSAVSSTASMGVTFINSKYKEQIVGN